MLYYELKSNNYNVEVQKRIKVYYKKIEIGEYFADIIVNNTLILELKSVESIRKEHHAQLINYPKATDLGVGLLLNFGKKPEFIRKVYQNYNK